MFNNTNLTKHGRSYDICEYVVKNFDNNPMYKDNKTVQQWVKDSKAVLITKTIRIP